MKKYIFLFSLLLVGLLTSCKEEIDDREPSPDTWSSSPFFQQSSIIKEFPIADNVTEDVIIVQRTKGDGNATFNLSIDEENSSKGITTIVNVPTIVTFEGNNTTSEIKLSFPKAEDLTTYKVTLVLEVDEQHSSPYCDGSTTCTYTFEKAQWSEVKTCIIYDAMVTTWFNFDGSKNPFYAKYKELTIESTGEKRIRILNPYCSFATKQDKRGVYDGFPANKKGDFDDDPDANYNMNLTLYPDGTITLKSMFTGMKWSYGRFYIGGIEYNSEKNPTMGVGVWDADQKKATFPEKHLVCGMENYDDFGLYFSTIPEIIYFDVEKFDSVMTPVTSFAVDVQGLPRDYNHIAVLFANEKGEYSLEESTQLLELSKDVEYPAQYGELYVADSAGLPVGQQYRIILGKDPVAGEEGIVWSLDAGERLSSEEDFATHKTNENLLCEVSISRWKLPAKFTLTTTLPVGYTRVGVAFLNPNTGGSVTDVYEMSATETPDEYSIEVPNIALFSYFTYVIGTDDAKSEDPIWLDGPTDDDQDYTFPDRGNGSWYYTSLRTADYTASYNATSWLTYQEVPISVTVTGGLPTGYSHLGVTVVTNSGYFVAGDITKTPELTVDATNPELFTGKIVARIGQRYLLAIAKEEGAYSLSEVEFTVNAEGKLAYGWRYVTNPAGEVVTTTTNDFLTLPDDDASGKPKKLGSLKASTRKLVD